MSTSGFVVKSVKSAITGQQLYTAPDQSQEVLDPDIAADTSFALQQVVKSGTGRAALGLGCPAAGKTGTATNGDDDVSSVVVRGLHTPNRHGRDVGKR
ncbi:MAG: penicillin-binding transpeptidase domain-containing protein [Marmoricola sp.]